MQKGKLKHNQDVQNLPELTIIHVAQDRGRIEMEIDQHVKSIRSLINRLRPTERQKYFHGLLHHMLNAPEEHQMKSVTTTSTNKNQEISYSNLSQNDLVLIRELSTKMEELYRNMDDDPS